MIEQREDLIKFVEYRYIPRYNCDGRKNQWEACIDVTWQETEQDCNITVE